MGNLRFRQIHLDFHTYELIEGVGNKFDPKEFAITLKEAGVDSITLFARCHHGMVYYDGEFQEKHPHLDRNLLKEQIKACHEVDIKAPIYITVGWDEFVAKKHPEWLERNPEGKPNGAGPLEAGWKKLCLNTPYIEYVEKQTIDVLKTFDDGIDGLFFDIIFQNQCYCNYCMKGMKVAGLDPRLDGDRIKYAKEVVTYFKKRMTALVRKYNKDCSIFYNAGHVDPDIRDSIDTYTHLELESLPSGGWGYDHFPITVRYARNFGKEYLAMTGRFHKSWADFGGYKNQPALEYECFTALANGAKCSIGDQLHPNGKINKETYRLISSVYKQIEKVEDWCDDVRPVTELAVITPEIIPSVRERLQPSIKGLYRMLVDAHYQFDIIDDKMDFDKYKVIILPDIISLDEDFKIKLESFINQGGKVLLSYKSGMNKAVDSFLLNQIGIEFIGDAEYSPDYVVAGDKINTGMLYTEHVMYQRGLYVKPLEGTETLAKIYNPYFNRDYDHFCSHAQTPVDKESGYPAVTKADNVIYFCHPIFSMYAKTGLRAYKQMFLNSLKLLLADKLVKTDAPTTAQIYLNYQPQQNRHVVHILHYIPERRCEDIETIEDVIPLYNVKLYVKLPHRPNKIYLAPSMTNLSFKWENGYAQIIVPEVIGHQIVVFE